MRPIDARRKSVDVLAQRVDALQQLGGLCARDQVAALVRQVFGEHCAASSFAACCVQPTAARANRAELVRGHVADQQRQLLFQIRPQQQRQLAKLLRQLGIAANLHIASLQHRPRIRSAKRQQAEGAAAYVSIGMPRRRC